MKKSRVLIVGSGGREAALFRSISLSNIVEQVFVAPGNDEVPSEFRLSISYNSEDPKLFIDAALMLSIDLVVVGPEGPIVAGIVDTFEAQAPSITVFGPSKRAAELEGSKAFMKVFSRAHHIPTADFEVVDNYETARAIISHRKFRVIKANGLRNGKGVKVVETEEQALAAVKELLEIGALILLEDKLAGREVSVMALCDGAQAALLPVARDYKRLSASCDVMTGGMGAYSPADDIDDELLLRIRNDIISPLLSGMKNCGRPYRGVLYAGIMVTKDGPMLLEVNCRLGDPEAQVILPRIESDLVPYFKAASSPSGFEALEPLTFKQNAAVCVCISSKDYPYSGHRLFSVVGVESNLKEARQSAYAKVRAIPGIKNFRYRSDIAEKI